MAVVGSLTEKAMRARREQRKNWTLDDEREWLEAHPEDTPLEGYEHATLPTPDEVAHDEDVIPDIEPYERSEEDDDIDALLGRIGIVEAYNRWANKGRVDPGRRTESIKVRCPNPAHPDNNPSAWLNTDKEVWVCAGCGFEGGDKFDIAAWGLGFSVPGYKDGKKFPELRRAMAVDLGYRVRHSRSTGTDVVEKVEEEVADEPEPEADAPGDEGASPEPEPEPASDDEPSASVTVLHPEEPPEQEELPKTVHIDWRNLVPEDTFLWEWLVATTHDDLPEEYHFWTGLTALGLAVGNDIYLEDMKPVHPNLFTTLIGNTGNGKSRSVHYLTRILHEVLPYDAADESNTGVAIIKGVGSGEALVDNFNEVHTDGDHTFTVPVRGLMHFDELATLVGKSSHTGSILKPVLMEFYDHSDVIAVKTRTFGSVEARDSFGSCVSTTQPNSLRHLVNRQDADSGFLNRWVFVWGMDKTTFAYGGVSIDLERASAHLRGVRSWAAMSRSHGMRLEGDALQAWKDFFYKTLQPIKAGRNADPLLARLDLTFKKLILLFAINRKELTPSLDSVNDALALWPYVATTYRLVGASLFSSEQSDLEDAIISYIQRRNDTYKVGPTRRQVVDNFKKGHDREDIRRALKTLEDLGLLEEVTQRKKGTRGPAPVTLEMTF